jgi:hypothetical protein
MYDLDRLITIRGVLSSVSWANPHVELRVETESASGEHEIYLIEIAPPSVLIRNGLSQDLFVAGELVEFEAHPAKASGRLLAWGRSAIRPDGTLLRLPSKSDFTPGQEIVRPL